MDVKLERWIEAAKKLVNNPNAKVSCPECNTGTLAVIDEPFGTEKIDRYLVCGTCGKYEVLTMNKPD